MSSPRCRPMWRSAPTSPASWRCGPAASTLTDLRGQLDGDTLSGSVGWKAGAPPAVAADLRLARIRLDPWLAGGPAATRLRDVVLHRLDADLRLDVRHASLGDTAIDGLTLDAATLGGGVMLRRLQGTVLDTHFAASFSLGRQGTLRDGSLLVDTGDAMPLRRLLPMAWRATPALWHGPARLEITAAGPRQAVAGSVSLQLGDLHLRAQPTLDLDAGTLRGSLTLRDPNAQRLISELGLPARFGLDGMPVWLGEGSLSLVARLGVGPGRRLSLDNAELVAGRLRTRLDLTLETGASQPMLTGTLAAETLPLPAFVNGPLPAALLQGWQGKLQVKAGRVLGQGETVLRDAAATVQVQQGRLSLDRLSGTLGGGALSGSASLDSGQKPPALSVQLRLSGASIHGAILGLPIDLIAGSADLSLSLRAAGYSAAALTATLAGSVQATVRDGVLSGFGLRSLRDVLNAGQPDPAALRATLERGETPFRQLALRATVARGLVSLDQAELSAPAGKAQATGTVALPDQTAELRITLHPDVQGQQSVALLLNGKLTALQRTPELAGLAFLSAPVAGEGRSEVGEPQTR